MLNLDIDIVKNCSLKRLIITDESIYGNISISNPSMEITPPGYNKVSVDFAPKMANSYNSVNLGISCDDFIPLPDGIYTIKYSIYPNSNRFIEKTFLRVALLQCKYGKFLLNLHLEKDCKTSTSKIKKVNEIRTLIEGAIAASNDCNIELAYELYDKANCMLDKIEDCKCN